MPMKSLAGQAIAVLILSVTLVLDAVASEKASDQAAVEPRETEHLEVSADTFICIRDMTKVRGFYVGKLKGDFEGTLAVANSEADVVYSLGSVVQLVPDEVMISMKKAIAQQQMAGSFLNSISLKLGGVALQM